MTIRATPDWFASPLARRLAGIAVAALIAAYATGRPAVLAFAAGPLILLAAAARTPPPQQVELQVQVQPHRCVEGDPVVVDVTLSPPVALAQVIADLPPGITVDESTAGPGTVRLRWVAHRWGPVDGQLRLCVTGGGGMLTSWCTIALPTVSVLPAAARLRTTPLPRRLLARLGEHPSRTAGAGIEFAGLRPYTPGDPVRDLNPSATIRVGQPMVTTRATERAGDLIVAVDAYLDAGPAGNSSLDVAVRGATGIAQAALRHRDRVGLIIVGGMLRWLRPEASARHFYRIAHQVVTARAGFDSAVDADLRRIPWPALPPSALVILFSPLLDERVFTAINALLARGNKLTIVDVLRGAPPVSPRRRHETLAARLWQLDRLADRADLHARGVQILAWPAGDLGPVLATATRGRPR